MKKTPRKAALEGREKSRLMWDEYPELVVNNDTAEEKEGDKLFVLIYF